MSWYNKDIEEEADGEVEGEDEENDYKNINDKIIFLIDAREDMFQRSNQNEIKFQNCLKLALQVMMSKVIANDNSSIGLVFFGTREKNKENGIDGIYTLFPPEIPSASKIRQLQAFIDDLDLFHCDIGSLPHSSTTAITTGGRGGGIKEGVYCPLREALWVCSQAFHTVASTLHKTNDFKRIWIFTNDDNPNKQSVVNQEKTIKVAQDCGETGIEISLFHLDTKNNNLNHTPSFNPDLFYMKLLRSNTIDATGDDGDDDNSSIAMRIQGSGEDGFDTMMVHVRRKMFRKRALGTFFLSFGSSDSSSSSSDNNSSSTSSTGGQGVCMSFKLYKSFSICKRPVYKWLYAQTNEPLKVMTFYIDGYTGEALSDDKIDTCIEFGNIKIPFNSQEMKSAKKGIMLDSTSSSGGDNNASFEFNKEGDDKEEEGSSGTGSISTLSILCFTSYQNLPDDLNIESSYYLFPDESIVKGSKNLYASLLHYLSSHHVIALVKFARTPSSVPRLAALIPSLHNNNDTNENTSPTATCFSTSLLAEGLHLVSLPFQEEIRRNPDPIAVQDILKLSNNNNSNNTSNNNDELKAAEALIDVFQLHGNESVLGGGECSEYWQYFQSPAMQQFYSVLQAVALSQTTPDWIAAKHDNLHHHHSSLNNTSNNHTTASNNMVSVLNQFQKVFGLSEGAIQDMMESGGGRGSKATVSRKRKADTSVSASSSNAAGRGADDGDSEVLGGRLKWVEMVQNNTLGKCTVVDLKSICVALNLPVSGTKAVLVDRITAALT